MKLLLCSQTLQNDSIRNALRGLLDKPVDQSVFLYIPTAANPEPSRAWMVEDMYQAKQMGWREFNVLDLAVATSWPKHLWWPFIENADVIMVGGGHSSYLSYWMHESGLAQALPELLKTKVYVGSSAGGMFLTPSQALNSTGLKNAPKYESALDDPSVPQGQTNRKTLNLVPFHLRPHWGAPTFKHITEDTIQQAADAIKTPCYFIDDETAIKVVDGQVEVVSEGKWRLFTPRA